MFGIFCSDSKEEIVSLSWENRTYSIPCGLPVFIFKPSESKKVGFYDDFLADFYNC